MPTRDQIIAEAKRTGRIFKRPNWGCWCRYDYNEQGKLILLVSRTTSDKLDCKLANWQLPTAGTQSSIETQSHNDFGDHIWHNTTPEGRTYFSRSRSVQRGDNVLTEAQTSGRAFSWGIQAVWFRYIRSNRRVGYDLLRRDSRDGDWTPCDESQLSSMNERLRCLSLERFVWESGDSPYFVDVVPSSQSQSQSQSESDMARPNSPVFNVMVFRSTPVFKNGVQTGVNESIILQPFTCIAASQADAGAQAIEAMREQKVTYNRETDSIALFQVSYQ